MNHSSCLYSRITTHICRHKVCRCYLVGKKIHTERKTFNQKISRMKFVQILTGIFPNAFILKIRSSRFINSWFCYLDHGMQGNLLQIQGGKAVWNKQQVWERAEEMLSMRALHKLGWQALPMLWLHPEDKAKRYADKTTIKDVATGKTTVDWRL